MTWQGLLLDGHNRYRICQRLGIEFKTLAIDLPDRTAAMVWIIRNQFGRRNLAPYTRAELALKLEPLIAAKAKENQGKRNDLIQKVADAVKDGKVRPLTGGMFIEHIDQKSDRSSKRTNQGLAKTAGLSHDTIAKAKLIAGTRDILNPQSCPLAVTPGRRVFCWRGDGGQPVTADLSTFPQGQRCNPRATRATGKRQPAAVTR